MPLDGMTREERRELRKKLKEDLMTVQSLALKVEARELQLRQSQSVQVHPTDDTVFSGNDVHPTDTLFAGNDVHPMDDTHFSNNDGKSSVGMEMTPLLNIKPSVGMETTPLLKIKPFVGTEMTPLLKIKPLGTETIPHLKIKPLNVPQLKIKPRVEILKQLSFRESEGSPTGTELVRNKRTPKANQLYNKADFVVGKDKMPTLPKSRSKHRSSKKKALNGNRKRQRSAFPTDIRLQCKSLLNKLMSHRDGWIFNKPVDAEKLGLTDYHFFIKSPMDLGTIRGKLDKKQYTAAQEFADDVRLTFSNAMTYNPPANDVHQLAIELLSIFEKGWEVIEEKLKRIEAERELELAQEANGKADGKKGKLKTPKTPSDPNGTSDPNAAPKPKVKRKRVMTLQQRQELEKLLEQLSQQQIENLISMMTERNVNLCRKGDEIEIDPDTFDNATLWELYRGAKSCLKRASKPKKTTTPRKVCSCIIFCFISLFV